MKEIILIPLDGSELAEAVIPFVEDCLCRLAPDVQREVILLHVLHTKDEPYPTARGRALTPSVSVEEMQSQVDHATEYLNKVGELLRNTGAKVQVKVVFGEPVEEIIKIASEVGARMIAISTHGRSGIRRWALGSVADKVLRHEKSIPVLVLKPHMEI